MARIPYEDQDIEKWCLFYEGKYHYYYVSDWGRVKYKNKVSKKEKYAKVAFKNGVPKSLPFDLRLDN